MLCQQFGSHLDHKAGEEDRPRAEAADGFPDERGDQIAIKQDRQEPACSADTPADPDIRDGRRSC